MLKHKVSPIIMNKSKKMYKKTSNQIKEYDVGFSDVSNYMTLQSGQFNVH